MSQNQTKSKPPSVEEPREEGLDETTCCASFVRSYFDVCLDSSASPLERETAMLKEWNAALHENTVVRGAMARLCRAVSRRMMPDDPTPEDRMELREAFDAASDILHNSLFAPTSEE